MYTTVANITHRLPEDSAEAPKRVGAIITILYSVIKTFSVHLMIVLQSSGAQRLFDHTVLYTWSLRKVSDRIFLCEHLMDYNLVRLHEPTLNLSAHA